MNMLDELFGKFDALTEKHGVYKIETIGDACELQLDEGKIELGDEKAYCLTLTPCHDHFPPFRHGGVGHARIYSRPR